MKAAFSHYVLMSLTGLMSLCDVTEAQAQAGAEATAKRMADTTALRLRNDAFAASLTVFRDSALAATLQRHLQDGYDGYHVDGMTPEIKILPAGDHNIMAHVAGTKDRIRLTAVNLSKRDETTTVDYAVDVKNPAALSGFAVSEKRALDDTLTIDSYSLSARDPAQRYVMTEQGVRIGTRPQQRVTAACQYSETGQRHCAVTQSDVIDPQSGAYRISQLNRHGFVETIYHQGSPHQTISHPQDCDDRFIHAIRQAIGETGYQMVEPVITVLKKGFAPQ